MAQPDPGSFRDPASSVLIDDDRVLRTLDERGLEGWSALSSSAMFQEAVDSGDLIASSLTDHGGATVLEHPVLDFISYPYEWTFSMLKDAALLQLRLLRRALNDGITIKDATPFNIQFVKGKPMFIDVGSFERYTPGEPWIGYRQFTRQFLFPLMMHSWVGVPFQPWLRGDFEGPTAADMKQLLTRTQRMKPASALHVSLQARMEERLEGEAVRESLGSAGFNEDLILANVKKLEKLIDGLEWSGNERGWVDYEDCTHVGRDRSDKGRFLRQALDRARPERVLDLGANDGFFSNVAADSGAVAIAVDSDEPVLDAVYRRGTRLNLALSDITNLSPSQGWAGVERRSLLQRSKPDLVVAYGIIHHLIYTSSIPPSSVVDWLAGFNANVVVEFVSPEDEMVSRLTANKREQELHPHRTLNEFEALMATKFTMVRSQPLEGGTRVLFELEPKSAGD